MPRAVVVGLVVALAVTAVRAQVVRPILLFPTEYASSVAVDQAGNVVYATTSTNQFGSNPAYRKQIVRWDAVTGIGTPVTNYEEGVESVSVSNDASWIAFVSAADPLGTNPDENPELYVMRPDGTGLVQLTSVGLYEEIRAAVISGSGARIAFIGNINPLGTNPTYANALFVIDRNGSNLRQLATGVRVGDPYGNMPGTVDQALPQLGISDDGSKVVYTKSSPSQFAGINADGTGDHALSSGSTPAGIVISGNGATVVTTTGSPLAYSITTRSFDGNPGTIVSIGAGDLPWITDDASTVYYYRSGTLAGIWKIAAGGGTPTLVKTGFRPLGVSGNGGRLVTYGALELVAIDGTGGSLRQLTTTAHREYVDLKRMASDGNDAQFLSTIDPLGTNPAHSWEYFSLDLNTGQSWQRTDASLPLLYWDESDIADDGSVFFWSDQNLTGQNPCGDILLYRRSPGGAYNQLTPCGAQESWAGYPMVRSDGQVLAFLSDHVNGYDLFSVLADGAGKTPLFSTGLGGFNRQWGKIAGTGPTTWVVFNSPDFPTNVYRVKADGTALQQLTSGPSDDFSPSISADGSVVAWISSEDYGQNPGHLFQNFVFEQATQAIRQLTSTGGTDGALTQDGQWYFGQQERIDVASGARDYVGGTRRASSWVGQVLPDATGSRWLLTESDAWNGGNTLLSLADMNAVPAFVVGKASPTVLSWDASPFSLRYDVIRGSVSNLSITGSTVSLGPVSCLENDSPDNHTRGHADPASPAPGQAFFYLYRGSVGFNATTGSYGQGTGGRERVAGAGGCQP